MKTVKHLPLGNDFIWSTYIILKFNYWEICRFDCSPKSHVSQKTPAKFKMKTRMSLGIACTWDWKKDGCSYSYSDLNMCMRISHQWILPDSRVTNPFLVIQKITYYTLYSSSGAKAQQQMAPKDTQWSAF